jgi:hypothetical protein
MPSEPKPVSLGVDVALVEEWGKKTTLIAKLQAEQVCARGGFLQLSIHNG